MKFTTNKKISVILTFFVLLIIILNMPLLNSIILQRESKITDNENIHTSKEKDWIESDFSSQGSWLSEIEGDESDIAASISQGYANYIVIGDSRIMNIDSPLSDTDWTSFNNPEFPIEPDSYGINSAGCYVSHTWDEGEDQTLNTPSMRWKRNITMPVNMSDYIITSAFLEVIFNATVTAEGPNPSQRHINGIERPGDYTEGNPPSVPQFGIGDSARFYVLISDVENNNEYQIAVNQTTDLGQDGLPYHSVMVNNYTDTLLDVVPEELLISYLTSVLENDNYNFTITLGIDIYCEDNEYNVDIDIWDLLIIRSFNLSFTYEKKIDKFTGASWNQIGEKLENSTDIQLDKANLKFKYKVDRQWPSNASYNSEIRFYINDKLYSEVDTIKLRDAETYFKDAKDGGYDVFKLITKGINISLSIQVFLKDTFELGDNITVSIDDLLLVIEYTVLSEKSTEEPLIFQILFIVALAVTAGLGGYLYLYQKILKYPKPVRKVRKYRKTLRRTNTPSTPIISSKKAFNAIYAGELSKTSGFLKVKPKEQSPPKTSFSPSPIKTTEKS